MMFSEKAKSVNHTESKSYIQILKSTSIIGGSSVINILLGIARTKILAVLLGPSGVGLMGLYSTVTGLVGTTAGMGIGSSGVRQIAEAAGTGDEEKIARTIITLRRVALFLGMLGMLIMLAFCEPISKLTFGNSDYADALALLSITLFFGAVSGGQAALIQGMRRIGDLAKLSVIGALLGTIFSIPIIYFFREKGIVPFLVIVSAMGILTSWWYARKIQVARISMKWTGIRSEASVLLKLGLVFMSTSLMTAGTMYFVRVLVARQLGLEATGLYLAASTLASLYVGFILNAMGADFYPRLTAVAQDNDACNRLVNEQAEVSLLLAVPGILCTLTFAPLVIKIFYSVKFLAAFEILRWQILGILLRVASWPMGFILLAQGKGKLFFWTELLSNAAHVGLIWLCIAYFGLSGTGMAFFGIYVFYWVLIFYTVRRLSGFVWSTANVKIGLMILPAVSLAFLAPYFLSDVWAMITGMVLTIVVGLFSLRKLYAIVGPSGALALWLKIKSRIGYART